MRTLSKSKILAFRQCPKRLWLEVHEPERAAPLPAGVQARFTAGNQVGEIARRLYDPKSRGQLLDPRNEGYEAAFARTKDLLDGSAPIFEAGFSAGGALALADVMLPKLKQGVRVWRMVEVKSTTSIDEHHREDVAIQSFVARKAGVALHSVALAHIDSTWVYPGNGDYEGLLKESEDLTEQALGRAKDVRNWIAGAKATVELATEPAAPTGRHCSKPYGCAFLDHCRSLERQPKYPAAWLPGPQKKDLKALLEEGTSDLRKVPDDLLNDLQKRVKASTLSGNVYFEAVGARLDLVQHKLPGYFLDFETVQFAVPIWKGTRPYQQIPYQFSVHRLSRAGVQDHRSFLDISGNDPSAAFANALIDVCGKQGPIFAYNATFESQRICELAVRVPRLRASLMAIDSRVVDLLPVAKNRYYHPSQQGSWSIKKLLPSIAPDLSYQALTGVQDGGMATAAYLEAITPETLKGRKAEIRAELLKYCHLDTLAMVRIWQLFSGRARLAL